jgi:hypothetical protein
MTWITKIIKILAFQLKANLEGMYVDIMST